MPTLKNDQRKAFTIWDGLHKAHALVPATDDGQLNELAKFVRSDHTKTRGQIFDLQTGHQDPFSQAEDKDAGQQLGQCTGLVSGGDHN